MLEFSLRWMKKPGSGRAPRRRPACLALALPALLALSGALAAAAAATPTAGHASALTLRECFAEVAAKPCEQVPHRSLEFADDVVVSPDGTSVYVAAQRYQPHGPGIDAITEFARGADGSLRPVGCLSAAGARGCRASRAPLEGVGKLAISPDGRDLYATASVGLLEFARGPTGRLHPIGCLAFGPGPGRGGRRCERSTTKPPLAPTDIALSPDGGDLYVTGAMKEKGFPRSAWVGGIYELARRPDGTVAPAPLGCFGPTDARGCANVASYYPLEEPVMSPDGSALYAIGYDAIWRFPRAADGSLGPPECALAAGPGCALGNADYNSLAISPDGSLLYLGAFRETAAYSIGPTGALTKVAATPIQSSSLALSPDGTRLYGAADNSRPRGIRAFAVGGGALFPLGGPFHAENVEDMAVTPDGATLLATTACACRGALLALSTNGAAPSAP